MIPTADVVEVQADRQSVALGNDGEVVEVWEYFALNIDDFAAAKTIVDHFDANPGHLTSKGVDFLGLFLRAKLTLKRQQIAFAQEQAARAAIAKVREQSRSVVGIAKSFVGFVKSVHAAVAHNPSPLALAVVMAVMLWLR
jgi:hypothetical protein